MTDLLARFADRARGAGGRVGAVVAGPDGTEALALDPDGVYLAASVIKLPLLMTLYEDAAAGAVSLEERVDVGARVDGSGVLRDLRDVAPMSLRDLAVLAMTVSDNTATNRLIERVGIDRVNARLAAWGCAGTRLERAMYDLDARARGAENVMTPRDTARLLARVVRGASGKDAAMSEVLRILERNTNVLRLGRYLPSGVTLAHKDGWMDAVENDVGLVRARSTVIVAGFTNAVDPLVARPLLGLLGLATAELAGADVGLPVEMVGGA